MGSILLPNTTSECFDTRRVDVKQQSDYWQYAISQAFVPLDCAIQSPQFWGSLDARSCSKLGIVHVQGESQHVERRKNKMNTNQQDVVLLSLMLKGSMGLVYNQQELNLTQGQFAFYDTTQEYDLNLAQAFEQIVISIPRVEFSRRLGRVKDICGVAFGTDHALYPFACNYIKAFFHAGALSYPQQDLISDHVLNMMSCIVEDSYQSVKPRKKIFLFEQIESFILANLHDCTFDIHRVAQQFQVSARYVSKLFQTQETTFGQFILLNRLQKSKDALQSTSHQMYSIQQIAYSFGFTDMSYFSREFKKRFAVTPSEIRLDRVWV
ncbi:AraC family transcriptional regulator [Acinetobacter rathckeae]|uniref:AraC family transcriptional regulator n=1 Tax=Acinetobacter rathckeae TaxID=2605272 RepID=UPI0018A28B16|nr:AraC family transcriptional regulator [Acinetobacter rathckeae]MBF7687364.1 AraC family transcriptional regulator [Acinetobacter rathckeae]MBF7694765.1 AraC family transcriptional regulator [Acinetobacter rathckeae]